MNLFWWRHVIFISNYAVLLFIMSLFFFRNYLITTDRRSALAKIYYVWENATFCRKLHMNLFFVGFRQFDWNIELALKNYIFLCCEKKELQLIWFLQRLAIKMRITNVISNHWYWFCFCYVENLEFFQYFLIHIVVFNVSMYFKETCLELNNKRIYFCEFRGSNPN